MFALNDRCMGMTTVDAASPIRHSSEQLRLRSLPPLRYDWRRCLGLGYALPLSASVSACDHSHTERPDGPMWLRRGAATSPRSLLVRRASQRFHRRQPRVCRRWRRHERNPHAAPTKIVAAAAVATAVAFVRNDANRGQCTISMAAAPAAAAAVRAAATKNENVGAVDVNEGLAASSSSWRSPRRRRVAQSRPRFQLPKLRSAGSCSRRVALAKLRTDSFRECFCTKSTMNDGMPTANFSEIASSTVMRVCSAGRASNFHSCQQRPQERACQQSPHGTR